MGAGYYLNLAECLIYVLASKILGVFVCGSTFGMVDSEETCIVVMVYNMANSWGVLIGDTVVIPEPLIKRNVITHKNEVGVLRF